MLVKINGFISKTGEFIECNPGQHIAKSHEICPDCSIVEVSAKIMDLDYAVVKAGNVFCLYDLTEKQLETARSLGIQINSDSF